MLSSEKIKIRRTVGTKQCCTHPCFNAYSNQKARNRMKRSYLPPRIESIIIVTNHIIAASDPASSTASRHLDNAQGGSTNSDWGNIWN